MGHVVEAKELSHFTSRLILIPGPRVARPANFLLVYVSGPGPMSHIVCGSCDCPRQSQEKIMIVCTILHLSDVDLTAFILAAFILSQPLRQFKPKAKPEAMHALALLPNFLIG